MCGRTTADRGFTFVETIVSIIILALVFSALGPLVLRSTATLGRLGQASDDLYRISTAYDAFRSACRRTLVPPWIASGSTVQENGSEWSISHFDGKAARGWGITEGEGTLSIRDEQGRYVCPATDAKVQPIVMDHRTIGLEIDFGAMGQNWSWREYFASSGY